MATLDCAATGSGVLVVGRGQAGQLPKKLLPKPATDERLPEDRLATISRMRYIYTSFHIVPTRTSAIMHRKTIVCKHKQSICFDFI